MATAGMIRVGGIRLGDHLCLPFDTDDERQEILTSFVRHGLVGGDKVLYITDTGSPETVLRFLHDRGVDPEPYVASGQLSVTTTDASYRASGGFDPLRMVEHLQDTVEKALTEGYPGVRMTGEMSWALRNGSDHDRLLDYEAHLGRVFAAGNVAGICQYDRRRFDPAVLPACERLHAGRVAMDAFHDDGILRITRSYAPPGLRLEGDVDMSTIDAMAAALATVVRSSIHDLHLDLHRLEFIDVAGIRLLVETAGSLSGRGLILHGVAPHLRRVMGIVGWDQAPGLHLAGDPQG